MTKFSPATEAAILSDAENLIEKMTHRPPKPTPLAAQIATSLDSLSGLAIGNCVLIPARNTTIDEVAEVADVDVNLVFTYPENDAYFCIECPPE